MIAPATISHCGPELAIMPGMALAKKPRISLSKLIRSGVASRALRCDSSIRQLQQAGDADGGRQHPCGEAGIGMPDEQQRPWPRSARC